MTTPIAPSSSWSSRSTTVRSKSGHRVPGSRPAAVRSASPRSTIASRHPLLMRRPAAHAGEDAERDADEVGQHVGRRRRPDAAEARLHPARSAAHGPRPTAPPSGRPARPAGRSTRTRRRSRRAPACRQPWPPPSPGPAAVERPPGCTAQREPDDPPRSPGRQPRPARPRRPAAPDGRAGAGPGAGLEAGLATAAATAVVTSGWNTLGTMYAALSSSAPTTAASAVAAASSISSVIVGGLARRAARGRRRGRPARC